MWWLCTAFKCSWLGFCHGLTAGNFEKKIYPAACVQFSDLVNWLPACFLHSKSAPRIHFRATAQTRPNHSGQVHLFHCQPSKLKSVRDHIRGPFLLHPASFPTLPIGIANLCFWMFCKNVLSLDRVSVRRPTPGTFKAAFEQPPAK